MRQSVTELDAPIPLPDGSLPSLKIIFIVFTKIALTSFGGGMSGWMMIEFVQRKRWMSEEEFLSGLALAQAFPGINAVNLSIWIGFQLRGGAGAFVATLGMIVPPMAVAIATAIVFAHLGDSPRVHIALGGIAAAAIGLSLQMGIRAAMRAARNVAPVIIMIITFVAIFIKGLPLIWVVLVMAPLSIGWAYSRIRSGKPA